MIFNNSMLNYILPPIVIVVSLAILIMFLFRKAEQISERDVIEEELQKNGKRSFATAAGQFWLKILERTMHRLKLLSLKLHNASNDWFHSIHEKRQRRIEMQKEIEEKNAQAGKDKLAEKNFFKNDSDRQPVEKIYAKQNPRPLVRERVVLKQNNEIKEKSKLEDVLIRRIAINPKDVEAYEKLGDYYLENGNNEDSLECFKQVLRLSPINYKARMKARRLEKLIK